MQYQAKTREPTFRRLMPMLAIVLVSTLAAPAFADRVSVVDPHTGKRHQLPDNNRDGRADYVPRYLGIDVNPGLVIPDNRARRERSSGGGTICHGNDGGTTISTARRACDPGAPAGDGGRASTVPNSSSTPTRPSRSSSTQLN